jgi:hypothetical protein
LQDYCGSRAEKRSTFLFRFEWQTSGKIARDGGMRSRSSALRSLNPAHHSATKTYGIRRRTVARFGSSRVVRWAIVIRTRRIFSPLPPWYLQAHHRSRNVGRKSAAPSASSVSRAVAWQDRAGRRNALRFSALRLLVRPIGIRPMAKTIYCWRCKREVPMLEEHEWEKISPRLQDGGQEIKEYRRAHGASLHEAEKQIYGQGALEHHFKITGFRETSVDALWHHRLTRFGPPCQVCGKPLRTPRAKLCAECGAPMNG